MSKKTYADKLKDPRWQKKRLEILNQNDFICQLCYEEGKTVNVHHLFYLPNHQPWEYPNFCYMVLCDDCHRDNDLDETFLQLIGLIDKLSKGAEFGYWPAIKVLENTEKIGSDFMQIYGKMMEHKSRNEK